MDSLTRPAFDSSAGVSSAPGFLATSLSGVDIATTLNLPTSNQKLKITSNYASKTWRKINVLIALEAEIRGALQIDPSEKASYASIKWQNSDS